MVDSVGKKPFSRWAVASLYLFAAGLFIFGVYSTFISDSVDFYMEDAPYSIVALSYISLLGPLILLSSFITSIIAAVKKNSLKDILPLLLFLLMILLIGISPHACVAREKARRISCASNLKQIGLGLKQYAVDFTDFFPPANGAAGMETLRSNNYITDYKLFTCLSTDHKSGTGVEPLKEDACDYVYIGGLSESCSADSILAYDKPNNHWRYGNVLFVDGHVEGFKGSNWLEKAANWQLR